LRTLFSWLRRALDPYLRPKTPARYFLLDGEVYCFAPDAVRGYIYSDMAAFEDAVQTTLAQAELNDLPLLPDEFLHALENWAPLLPELPYEPWAVTARERVTGLYVEGCLHAAQTLLHLRREPEAAHWARNAIQTAPWLEEAYQALMRAQARQGQRSLALRTYTEAVEALERELDVAPSALTEWLAQRVRQGEHI
jgi:LuxR family transcriptional regulator, maltose regulon positive regulatory protein